MTDRATELLELQLEEQRRTNELLEKLLGQKPKTKQRERLQRMRVPARPEDHEYVAKKRRERERAKR